MKYIFTTFLICSLFIAPVKAQPSNYRIFGKVSTVNNEILKGYITWNQTKLWWTDYFEAAKPSNPYANYFTNNEDIYFTNNNTISTKPPVHAFICRFGNISKIRLIGTNKIELQIKNNHYIELLKGTGNDIGQTIKVFTGEGVVQIKWEQVSEVEFCEPDSNFVASIEKPITGIARTEQGIYKGIIAWSSRQNTLNSEISGRNVTQNISIPFHNIRQINQNSGVLDLTLNNGSKKELKNPGNGLQWELPITVYMPNIGSVNIPWRDLETLEVISNNDIKLLSYNDFSIPYQLKGEVTTKKGQKINGILAYDLDENMDFEILDGKNANISYRIPFRYIRSVEPKNYKYSFITLRDENTLSLGDSPDVNETNSGVIVSQDKSNPTYIPWKEIESIKFQD